MSIEAIVKSIPSVNCCLYSLSTLLSKLFNSTSFGIYKAIRILILINYIIFIIILNKLILFIHWIVIIRKFLLNSFRNFIFSVLAIINKIAKFIKGLWKLIGIILIHNIVFLKRVEFIVSKINRSFIQRLIIYLRGIVVHIMRNRCGGISLANWVDGRGIILLIGLFRQGSASVRKMIDYRIFSVENGNPRLFLILLEAGVQEILMIDFLRWKSDFLQISNNQFLNN